MSKTSHPKSSILVTGAGGFIGGHLVAHLRKQGIKNLRAVDIKPFSEWYQKFDDVDNHQLDLRELEACRKAAKGMEWIYNLAADMGGMGFIELHKAECMLSVLINTHMLMADEKPLCFYHFSGLKRIGKNVYDTGLAERKIKIDNVLLKNIFLPYCKILNKKKSYMTKIQKLSNIRYKSRNKQMSRVLILKRVLQRKYIFIWPQLNFAV